MLSCCTFLVVGFAYWEYVMLLHCMTATATVHSEDILHQQDIVQKLASGNSLLSLCRDLSLAWSRQGGECSPLERESNCIHTHTIRGRRRIDSDSCSRQPSHMSVVKQV